MLLYNNIFQTRFLYPLFYARTNVCDQGSNKMGNFCFVLKPHKAVTNSKHIRYWISRFGIFHENGQFFSIVSWNFFPRHHSILWHNFGFKFSFFIIIIETILLSIWHVLSLVLQYTFIGFILSIKYWFSVHKFEMNQVNKAIIHF